MVLPVIQWNTKWEVHDVEANLFEDGETSNLHLGFNSAWSPPTGAYDTGADRLKVSASKHPTMSQE